MYGEPFLIVEPVVDRSVMPLKCAYPIAPGTGGMIDYLIEREPDNRPQEDVPLGILRTMIEADRNDPA